jgi:hypothetical protein
MVYAYLHYAGTFLFFAFILGITGVFIFTALPNKLNRTDSKSEHDNGQEDENEDEELASMDTEDSDEKIKSEK